MLRKTLQRITSFIFARWRDLLFYACLTAVLTAAAFCAEEYRSRAGMRIESVSAPAETVSEEQTEESSAVPGFRLPENAVILRGFSTDPEWNETLGLYESHPGTDIHFEDGRVLSISDGTVASVCEDGIRIETGLYRIDYRSLLPDDSISAGMEIRCGEPLGTEAESDSKETWMPGHIHLELRDQNNEQADPAEILVKNMS